MNDVDGGPTVPGMAEAIEARRLELGLTPGQFAAAAGLTRQGLNPVRQGRRKQYQDKVKIGVARALGWHADALDRLLNGDTPIPLGERGTSIDTTDIVAELTALRAEVARLRDLYEPRGRRPSDAPLPPEP